MTGNDLIISNARLADGRLATVRIVAGIVTAIEPADPGSSAAASGPAVLDAAGDLLLPALVEGHCHLDKTWFGMPWMENETGLGIAERAAYEREVEARIAYPTALRAGRLIEQMVAHGSTRINSRASRCGGKPSPPNSVHHSTWCSWWMCPAR